MHDIRDVDILIVGGGLTGMALTCALAPLGYKVCLAEAKHMTMNRPDKLETRSIALSPASIQILKQLGVWDRLQDATAFIEQIHISEKGKFGQARLQDSPLGAVVEMHVLYDALKDALPKSVILAPAKLSALNATKGIARFKTDAGERSFRARWVVAADGAHSKARLLCGAKATHKVYEEYALATNIALSRAHHQVAYERFTKDGPLALLPLCGDYMALVWTLKRSAAKALEQLSAPAFLAALQGAFGYRAGRMLGVGPRALYPLEEVLMPKQVQGRVVFIGNAAHTLHPVAGQGFNLGLRDVAMLAECAATEDLTEATLTHYERLRQSDQKVIAKATDGLVHLFKSEWPGVGFARRLGLVALDNSTAFQEVILRHAKGFGGVVSSLVCGVPLVPNQKRV